MKKTIAALALSASSTGFALMLPAVKVKTICLNSYEAEGGVQYAGNCDEAANNKINGLEILKNGCAEGQIALTSVKHEGAKKFDIEIGSCLPPNVAQL